MSNTIDIRVELGAKAVWDLLEAETRNIRPWEAASERDKDEARAVARAVLAATDAVRIAE